MCLCTVHILESALKVTAKTTAFMGITVLLVEISDCCACHWTVKLVSLCKLLHRYNHDEPKALLVSAAVSCNRRLHSCQSKQTHP